GKTRPFLIESIVERNGYERIRKIDASKKDIEIRIKSREDYTESVKRHPYLEESSRFERRKLFSEAYLDFQGLEINSLEDMKRFSKERGIPLNTVKNWDKKQTRPRLLKTLESHNKALLRYERGLSEDARKLIIHPADVYNAFRLLKNAALIDTEKFVDCLAYLCSTMKRDVKVRFARMYPYHHNGPLWIKRIGEAIGKNLSEIEKKLNARLGFDQNPNQELKVGVVGNKLYFRHKSIFPNEWINLYASENFHLRSVTDKREFVNQVRSRLALKGNIELSRLVSQLTDYSKTISDFNPNIDLRYTNARISGETLELMLDILGKRLYEIQNGIKHIGRGKFGFGVIRNPKLDQIPEEVIIPLVSIVASDGHIDPNGHITYTDNFADRIKQVRDSYCRLGDVDLSEIYHEQSGKTYLHAPSVVGRLLVKVGMTTGDKAIHNTPLPDIVKEASPENKKQYLRELISEDGSFHVDADGNGEFQWYRSVVLHAGNKAERYNHEPLISEEEIQLIINKAEQTNLDYGNEGEKTSMYLLRIGYLKHLITEKDSKISSTAKRLLESIESNPPQLLEDERKLCDELGIETRVYATGVRFFPTSGRVSASWQSQTAKDKDAERWARIARPTDKRKGAKSDKWLQGRSTSRLEWRGLK
ncbi:MAG: hypothetical protein ACW98K_17350, partial [Candidatus Kariarchaeaceae archaeon]